MLDPGRYWPVDRVILGARLTEVVEQIIAARQQLHDALVEERRIRYHTFQTSTESSVAGRERAADIESFAHWCAVQDCTLDLKSLEEERDLIRYLLELTNAGGE